MTKKNQIIIGSPIDYEELVAYIWIDGKEVALLQKEEGIDKMKIEFFEEITEVNIYFNDFNEALNEARNELMK